VHRLGCDSIDVSEKVSVADNFGCPCQRVGATPPRCRENPRQGGRNLYRPVALRARHPLHVAMAPGETNLGVFPARGGAETRPHPNADERNGAKLNSSQNPDDAITIADGEFTWVYSPKLAQY